MFLDLGNELAFYSVVYFLGGSTWAECTSTKVKHNNWCKGNNNDWTMWLKIKLQGLGCVRSKHHPLPRSVCYVGGYVSGVRCLLCKWCKVSCFPLVVRTKCTTHLYKIDYLFLSQKPPIDEMEKWKHTRIASRPIQDTCFAHTPADTSWNIADDVFPCQWLRCLHKGRAQSTILGYPHTRNMQGTHCVFKVLE